MFDYQRVLPGLLINADFDRSLAARITTGLQRDAAIRTRAVLNGFMVIATTPVVHDRIHHDACKYRLRLQRPNGQYEQEQQGSQG
jgi:hypothetical protein